MPGIAKILLSGLIGASVCAALGFLMFFLMTISSGNKLPEAFVYGLLVGIGCAFIGLLIGLATGIGNLSAIGGGIVGFVGTICVVAFYVFYFGRPGETAHFLSESRIIFIVLTLPTVLTGVITPLIKDSIYKP
ncbi:MAG TPA: hypothetical protein VE262_12630 [Blastocatellia bacterium]|nr:hypothetical protein [Blastocatellia bacterium]